MLTGGIHVSSSAYFHSQESFCLMRSEKQLSGQGTRWCNSGWKHRLPLMSTSICFLLQMTQHDSEYRLTTWQMIECMHLWSSLSKLWLNFPHHVSILAQGRSLWDHVLILICVLSNWHSSEENSPPFMRVASALKPYCTEYYTHVSTSALFDPMRWNWEPESHYSLKIITRNGELMSMMSSLRSEGHWIAHASASCK